jgi:hypothetical protein
MRFMDDVFARLEAHRFACLRQISLCCGLGQPDGNGSGNATGGADQSLPRQIARVTFAVTHGGFLFCKAKSASLSVAAVALAGFGHRFSVPATILGQRPPDIIAFGEAAVIVAADISLVAPGVNQFTLVSFAFRGSHCG